MTTETNSVTVQTVAAKAVQARPVFYFEGATSWRYAQVEIPADVALWNLIMRRKLPELMG